MNLLHCCLQISLKYFCQLCLQHCSSINWNTRPIIYRHCFVPVCLLYCQLNIQKTRYNQVLQDYHLYITNFISLFLRYDQPIRKFNTLILKAISYTFLFFISNFGKAPALKGCYKFFPVFFSHFLHRRGSEKRMTSV